MKRMFIFWCIILLLSLGSTALTSQEYSIAVKELPPVTDYFVGVVKAVVEASGNTAKIQVVPPARADYLISTKAVDVQYPIIVITDQKQVAGLKYDFSTVRLYKVAFNLFTNKDKPIDIDSLRKGNPKGYKIETDPSRLEDFNFPATPTTNLEASMKKLSNGAIDGFVFSQNVGVPILKKLGIKNIKWQLWNEFDEAFSIPKGAIGGKIDKMLSAGVAKLKATGKWEKLTGEMARVSKYIDWQP